MARTSVKILGINNFASHQLSIIRELADNDLQKIAIETQKRLQFNIQASIQRPGSTGKLANAMLVEKIPNGWGVGNIEYLDKTVPYWRWINFGRAKSGRTIPPASLGYFNPGTSYPDNSAFRTGRWSNSYKAFLITPQKPIQPHNYIARTLQQQNHIIASVLNKRRRI